MRDVGVIDSELRPLVAIREMVCEEEVGHLVPDYIDGLLDERRKLARASQFSV
jgi:hypothetical protein